MAIQSGLIKTLKSGIVGCWFFCKTTNIVVAAVGEEAKILINDASKVKSKRLCQGGEFP
jgi:hypothetical protein